MADPLTIQTNNVSSGQTTSKGSQSQRVSTGTSFAETLAEAQNLKFSNHAQKRLEKRNISLTDEGLARLNDAVNKAEKRGGQESLVLMDDLAFIVNVRERMVVTAMDSESRRDGVFTQIDSVVFAEPTVQPAGDAGSSNDGIEG